LIVGMTNQSPVRTEILTAALRPAPDITVVLSTFNNHQELRRTLNGFLETQRNGLEVEFAIIDNHSTDETKTVVESFADRLCIQYLYENKQGKCAALNRALSQLKLGKIVFFTDDDVDVPHSLFHQIIACVECNKAYSVFGGGVQLVWPGTDVPHWARALANSFKAYSHLDLGLRERAFRPPETPVGTNWWVRREVLQKGYRFDERIGPGSKRCSMGDETAFLLQLEKNGYPIMYTPKVKVGHRVPSRLLSESAIMRRGLAAGGAGALLAYEYGFGPNRYIKSDFGWRLVRAACLARWMLRYGVAFFSVGKCNQMLRRWDAMQGIGWNLEALRISLGRSIT
jgi:L-malate glycosyltransferase